MKFKIFILILIQGHSMSSYSSGYRDKRQISIGFGIPGLDNQQIGGAINSFLGGLLGQNQQQSQPNQANPQGHGGQSFNQFGGPPGGHHHGGFNQGGFNQGGFNQGGFNQGGFNQGGFNQGGFNQGGCNVNNGGCEQGCRVSRRGRTKCYCNPGFFLLNDRRSCGDIDECSNEFNQPLCQELCTNTIGSYLCGCSDGRTLRPDGSCIITGTGETCAVNNGGCHQFCRDRRRRGGVRCRCSEGYELGPDGKSCLDLDECTLGFHDCGPLPCVNTEGGYDCGAPAPNGPVPTAPAPVPTAPVPVPTAPVHVPTAPVPVPIAPAPVPTAPAHRGCGMNSKKSLFTRIVGGKPADPKDWPWMAALLRGGAQNQQFCGGTLINDRHVLTAAHCINSVTASDITVRLGEYSFDTPNENSPTDFKVAGIVKHPGYDTQTQENDIAIIKLDRPTASTEFIRPACLPPPNNNFNGQLGYVTGWGTIFFGGPVSNTLQEVVIPVWNQVDCVAAYPNNKVADSMMCCGQKIGGKDSCQGDSGGPFLVQIFPDNRWYVAGIVSWGIECASPNKPGVYTRVNHYLDWIASNSV